MASSPEKRSEDRHTCDAVIMWAYFNTSNAHDARMMNVSRSGGYFESSQEAIPGATLFIRVQNRTSSAGGHAAGAQDAIRSAALGEVKWCREMASGSSRRFGIGFRYHIPV